MGPLDAANTLYPTLLATCQQLVKQFDQIPQERKEELAPLSSYIAEHAAKASPSSVIVICTHNSRRSHIGQLWLVIAAAYYGIDMQTYSGGTEATAFYPSAVEAMKRCGLSIKALDTSPNPSYEVSWTATMSPQICFSKKFDNEVNPKRDFAAVMVCNSAAEACPFVPGCAIRLAIPYIDPKFSDGKTDEREVYFEKALEIGREMLYVLSQA